jgi:hypothetical protein
MDRSMRAMEANLLSFTIWNYTPDNTNARGDLWNDEDLSIFSLDQQDNPGDINSGGRALQAVLRPYPKATAGQPVSLFFDMRKRRMDFSFIPDPAISAPTEIYVPTYQYPQGIRVTAPSGRFEYDPLSQTLCYWPITPGGIHTIRIVPAK